MVELDAPPAARRDTTADDFFGTRVPDPYRWLEDSEADRTRAWAKLENERTDRYLRRLPTREQFKERLARVWTYRTRSVPVRHGERTFYFENDGSQDHPILYVQDAPEAAPRVLLDPNSFSSDGSVALTTHGISSDGKKLAYVLSRGGSKWTEVHVRDVDTCQDEPDILHWTAFPTFAWMPDTTGFYYTRFPEPAAQPTVTQTGSGSVHSHRLGTPQSDDTLAFQLEDVPGAIYWIRTTDDGRLVIVDVAQGTDRCNGIYLRRLDSDEPFECVFETGRAAFSVIGTVGSHLYFATDLDSPRGRVISVDLDDSRREIRTIVPESQDVIGQPSNPMFPPGRIVGETLVVVVTRNAHHEIRVYGLDGTPQGTVGLPGPGSVPETAGRHQDRTLFFTFESYLHPPTVMQYDPETDRLDITHKPDVPVDLSAYVTDQVTYPSRDGTSVPMFVTHARDVVCDASNPTLLYGYGGFALGITPEFSPSVLPWLEQGGIYAVANIRGGNELGEEWHAAGMLGNKQNVFDDFMAAAEYLQREGYTSRSRIAIRGQSNGGLLVASCMVQRPDLYGAVVCEVPVIDMLRYHRFSSGIWWVAEYGNAEADPDHFRFLRAYSPLHNVRDGVCYPPTLVATADGDDHVVPAHAMKFVASLQAAQACDNPILLQVRSKIGHGGGKPIWKIVDEDADIFAFLFQALDCDWSA